MKYRCNNCGHTGQDAGFPEARNPERRFEPGDIHTDKECPTCGALAHPVKIYHIMSSTDGNDFFDVEAGSMWEAALAGLAELGWGVVSPDEDEDA